jgi:hypothetical protein
MSELITMCHHYNKVNMPGIKYTPKCHHCNKRGHVKNDYKKFKY